MDSADVSASGLMLTPCIHGTAAAPGGLVMIDPARITEFSAVRPVDVATVERILARLAVSQKFGLEHAVTGRINALTGDVYILDGAHRCMAVLLGRERGMPAFTDMLVPMVVQEEEQNDACDAVVAVQSNENTMLHKQMTFPDYAVFLARVRDSAHEANFKKNDSTELSKRTYSWVADWTSQQSAPGLRSRVNALLEKKQLNIIYNIVQAIRPYTPQALSSDFTIDRRAWDMFLICSGYLTCDFSMRVPFPSVSELSTQSLASRVLSTSKSSSTTDRVEDEEENEESSVVLSRKTLDCPFFRGGARRTKGDPKRTAFGTNSMASPFEQVLFMSAVSAMRATQFAKKLIPRQRKKAKILIQSAFRSSEPGHGQRIGFAVRSVVGAWDKLAVALRFKNAEDMLSPYILFDRACMRFLPIERTRGWAPLQQRLTLLKEFSAEISGERVDPRAAAEDHSLDAQLRIAATRFLDNVMQCATDNRLFGDNVESAEAVLKDFTAPAYGSTPLVQYLRTFIASLPALAGRIPDGGLLVARAPAPSTVLLPSVGVAAEPRIRVAASAGYPALDKGSDSPPNSVTLPTSGVISHSSQNPVGPGYVYHNPATLAVNESVPLEDTGKLNIGFSSAEDVVDNVLDEFAQTYNCCFRDFVSLHESKTGKQLDGTVQLVLTDPPYNTRRERDRRNSAHDSLTLEDLQNASTVISSLLRPGGHAIIFCDVQQFKDWKISLEERADMIVDSMPMALVRAPGTYFQRPSRKSTTLVNMYELAVHATKRGEGRGACDMVSYRTFDQVPSRFRGWCNVIDNVPKPSMGESMMRADAAEAGTEFLRSEQKPVLLMRELIYRFSKAQDTVVDLFSGTYSTAVACITVPDGCYRHFVGCEHDRECHSQAKERLRAEFAKQYKKGSFGNQDRATVRACNALVTASATVREVEWMQPAGYPVHCCLPAHISSFLSELWSDPEFTERWGEVPLDKWPAETLSRLEQLEEMEFSVLRAVECNHYGLAVRTSTIANAGDGVFATRTLKKGDVVGWYNGTLVYRDIGSRCYSPTKYYGPRFLGCTVGRYAMYALQLRQKLDGNRAVYVVPPRYCVATMMNDPREVDKDGNEVPCSRMPNVSYTEGTVGMDYLTAPSLVEISVSRDISVGEELFIDYGNKFSYWKE